MLCGLATVFIPREVLCHAQLDGTYGVVQVCVYRAGYAFAFLVL